MIQIELVLEDFAATAAYPSFFSDMPSIVSPSYLSSHPSTSGMFVLTMSSPCLASHPWIENLDIVGMDAALDTPSLGEGTQGAAKNQMYISDPLAQTKILPVFCHTQAKLNRKEAQ